MSSQKLKRQLRVTLSFKMHRNPPRHEGLTPLHCSLFTVLVVALIFLLFLAGMLRRKPTPIWGTGVLQNNYALRA